MIKWLENYYLSKCDGDWEHQYGILIKTLDNPGWEIEIDIKDNNILNIGEEKYKINRSENDWIYYWREGNKLIGTCGPKNLNELLTCFSKLLTIQG